MEAADGLNDSRVIVACADPYGLFDQVAPLLQARFPIANLHWKSRNRPARSIDELEVLLKKEEPYNGGTASSTRKHQIPGLRQSPYVKVLLVRCDDRDFYRTSVRKSTKEWVKGLEISTSGKTVVKGQERHDAYEYLIVHVVLPDTPVAAQLKSSKNIPTEAFESTDSLDNKSKWTGKSPSTVFDKLRADFHSTSKAPFERVVQIRLSAPGGPNSALSAADIEGQWQDLIEKLKSAILQSFDARVAQYEEDIREREGQRHLPGWNFCTYFILKEGLAHGFKNVGLLQDALAVYEELDLELDLVVQDQLTSPDNSSGSSLLPYSPDLKRIIREALSDNGETNSVGGVGKSSNGLESWLSMEANNLPWRLDRKDYQAMILTNQISLLDFRTYLFIRKVQILLRRANVVEVVSGGRVVNKRSGAKWDADILSDVCERSISFMHTSARTLRRDLLSAWGGHESSSDTQNKNQHIIIKNIVASWKWSAMLQTLSDCQIISTLTSNDKSKFSGAAQDGVTNENKQYQDTREHCHSSSVTTDSSQTSAGTKLSHESVTNGFFTGIRVAKGKRDNLIFWSGEILYILSTILVQLTTDVNRSSEAQGSWLLRVIEESKMTVDAGSVPLSGVLSPSLRWCLRDGDALFTAHTTLLHGAHQCYLACGRVRICRQLARTLACLDSHKGDHVAAAKWFDQIDDMLHAVPQVQSDIDALELYARCLRAASRYADAASALGLVFRAPKRLLIQSDVVLRAWHALVEVATLVDIVEVAWDSLFILESVDRYVSFGEGGDSFKLVLRLRTLCPLKISMPGCVSLRLCNVQSSMPATIDLVFQGQVEVSDTLSNIVVSSSTFTQGWFEIATVSVELGHLRLQHDLRPRKREPLSGDDEKGDYPEAVVVDDRKVLLYPSDNAPWIEALHAPEVDLTKKRSIWIKISWHSTCEEVMLKIKPSTAGCRLDIQATTLVQGTPELCRTELSESGQIILLGNTTDTALTTLAIPYSVDHAAIPTISISTELTYKRAGQECKSLQELSILVALPLSVNVQESFQKDLCFSTFSFAPSFIAPVIIHQCETVDSEDVIVDAPSEWSHSMEVYTRSTATWPVRIRKRNQAASEVNRFLLTVEYSCMDEAVQQSITSRFREDIEHSEYSFAVRPLMRHLTSQMQELLTEPSLESATMMREIVMFSSDTLNWADLLQGLSPSCRHGLAQWLSKWHQANESMSMNIELAPVRRLSLRVDVPQPQVIITAALQPQKPVFILGEPMSAILRISVICSGQTKFDVTVEILNQGDTWTIGGAQKASLTTHQGDYTGTVFLVAHRLGSLVLPALGVRCVNAAQRNEQVRFEVHDATAAKTVFVQSNVVSTTLAFGSSEDNESSNSHWIVSTEHGDQAC